MLCARAGSAQQHRTTIREITLRGIARRHPICWRKAAELLEDKPAFSPPFGQRIRTWLRTHPDDFYLPGIAVLTFAIVSGVVLLLTEPSTPLGLIFCRFWLCCCRVRRARCKS